MNWLREHLFVFYTAVLLLHLINVFLQNGELAYILGILAIVMIVVSFRSASKLFRILGGIFLISGALMFYEARIPVKELPLFFTSNMPLLAFFAVLPWINSAVHVGKYDKRISELIEEKVEHLGSLYGRSITTTFILVAFLNLSAISLSQQILIKNLKKIETSIRNAFISKTTLRAFCLALIWSPMEIAVALVVDFTKVSYLVYLPWLLLIAIIVLCIDILIGRMQYKSVPFQTENIVEGRSSVTNIFRNVFKLLIALSVFLATVIIIGNVFNLNFILTVTLVMIPFSFAWAFVMKKGRTFRILSWKVWKRHMNHMQNFVVLFISLAFFSNSLNETAFLDIVQRPFFTFASYPIILFYFILVTYLLMAMLGVHPIATVGILLELLVPLFNVLNPVSIGIVLIVSALATSGSGTYGIAVTMTSININQNPYKITLRNIPFTIIMGTVGILTAYLLL